MTTNNDNQQPAYAFEVFVPREQMGRNTYWHRIGVAFQNQKKKGFTLKLDSLPMGDTLVLLEPGEPKEPEARKTPAK